MAKMDKITFLSDVEVSGNLTVAGEEVTSSLENVVTKQNTITLREGASIGLLGNEYTGIIAEKYDGVNNGMLVFDAEGTAYVGDEGEIQPLMTRSESSEMVDNGLVKWNANTNSAETLSLSQEPGISETAVMSQKAVSENFASAIKGHLIGNWLDLHDCSSVKHPVSIRVCSTNRLPYPYVDEGKTKNGVTMTRGEHGEVIFNGTATAITYFYLSNDNYGHDYIEGSVSTEPQNMSEATTSNYILTLYGSTSKQIKLYLADKVYFHIPKGTTFDGGADSTYQPQIEYGTTSLSYYEYKTDFTGSKITVTCTNKDTYEEVYQTIYPTSAGEVLSPDNPIIVESPPENCYLSFIVENEEYDYSDSVEIEYNKDTLKAIEELLEPIKQAIISLGGNV